MEEKGVRRTFWMPNELDTTVEETRRKIGMKRSRFYRYAVIQFLQSLSVLSTKAHEKELVKVPA